MVITRDKQWLDNQNMLLLITLRANNITKICLLAVN